MRTKILTIILLIFIIAGSIKFVNSNYFYNHIKRDGVWCENFIENDVVYCNTDRLIYYGTEVNFGKVITMETNGENAKLKTMDVENLKILRDSVKDKALKNSKKIIKKSKRELVQEIIAKKHENLSDEKEQILEDIARNAQIVSYINKADKVVTPKEIPSLKILGEKDIKYAAIYNNEIINYYSKDGELVFREFRPNGETVRYQTFDKDGNFYTYDKDQNLIEYSIGSDIYNSKKELMYTSRYEDKEAPIFTQKELFRANLKKRLLHTLNNPNSDLYKSITKVIDKHYDSGSSEEMIEALNEYFANLKDTDPKLFYTFKNTVRKASFTINVGKVNDRYVFSINGSDLFGSDKIAASMADTMNLFHGKCAEPNLKALVKNNLYGKYFYDIKIITRKGVIKCKEHPPCKACSKNTSLWGWAYPYHKSKNKK